MRRRARGDRICRRRLEAAIDRAMSLNPAARFPSVRALGAELLPYASARGARGLDAGVRRGGSRARWRSHAGGRRGTARRGRGAGARGDQDDVAARGGLGAAGHGDVPAGRRPCARGPPPAAVASAAGRGDRGRAGGDDGGVGERRAADGGAAPAVEPVEAVPAVAAPAVAAPVRAVPRPVPATPVSVRAEAGSRPIVPTVDRPAVRAPLIRRRKSRIPREGRDVPRNAIDPLPELRTNVPIPD